MENEYIDVPGGFELPTKEEYKFIKLFEEYLVKYNSEYGPINCSINIPGITLIGIHESVIISKQFGFIERLVENDKIEREKTNIEKSDDKRYDEGIVLASNYDNDTYVVEKYYSYVEQLLMILSIQDNPLEYLCSILK